MGEDVKIKQNQIIDSPIFKKVRGLALKSGQTLTDIDITKATQVVVYFKNQANGYRNNAIIPNGETEWYYFLNALDTFTIFFAVQNWTTGLLSVSSYSTSNNNVAVIGYDLIK